MWCRYHSEVRQEAVQQALAAMNDKPKQVGWNMGAEQYRCKYIRNKKIYQHRSSYSDIIFLLF